MMKILDYIDSLSEWSGLVVRWLGLILSLVVIFEVASRYLFNSPSIWAFDTAMMLTSTLFLMGGAYLLKHDAHIRVDVIYNLLPAKAQSVIDILFYLTCFFPFTIIMVIYGWKSTMYSFNSHEISNTSQWGEPIFWWRGILPLAFFLLTLQGVSKFVRIVRGLFGPKQEEAS